MPSRLQPKPQINKIGTPSTLPLPFPTPYPPPPKKKEIKTTSKPRRAAVRL